MTLNEKEIHDIILDAWEASRKVADELSIFCEGEERLTVYKMEKVLRLQRRATAITETLAGRVSGVPKPRTGE